MNDTPHSDRANMVEEQNGSVRIGLKDVYMAQQESTREVMAAVGSVKEDIAKISGHIEMIDSQNLASDRAHQDYENRIRALEHWRYALPTTILVSAASIVISVVEWLSRTH
jgi:hypothetical protein